MKFVIRYALIPERYEAAMKLFLQTGAQPPSGVTLLSRYHGANGVGFIVAESPGVGGIVRWLADWMELCTFEVVPVVEDAEAGAIQSQRMQHSSQ